MKLLVGLGNPGEKYENTRHNIGFMVVDQFLKDFPSSDVFWANNGKFKSDVAEITWQPEHSEMEKVILAKPKTYMNDSGLAVKLLVDFYKIDPSDVWILHDDVDFPIGAMKIRMGGASAGHRGIMSIIDAIGTDKFYRFRLGIGRPGESEHSGVAHYVLDSFSHEDHSKIRELLKRTSKAMQMGLEEGLDAAMNRYNTK
jgi:peptidyl-tRNA hydrolase, PTH1 family